MKQPVLINEAVNLENCAREPIHIPGSIQPHGLLFVLRELDLTILQVSQNVELFLGIAPELLLERGLSTFLNEEQVAQIRFALASVDPTENNPVQLQLQMKHKPGQLDGFVHRHDGFAFLELEPATLAAHTRFLDFYRKVSALTTTLHESPTLPTLLNDAVVAIRELTGYDRVMIYRFSENFEGEVVAEARTEAAESFDGLWFPASDIPEQARRLYVLNPIRGITDVRYVPVPLVPVLNPDSQRPTDLSFAFLRSVSPLHCEYLQNMGVAASMSISILRNNQLWGLVACHHLSPKYTPYEIRKACTFIGQVLNGEIGRRQTEGEAAYQTAATIVQANFLGFMATAPSPLLGLVNSSPNLLDLIPAEGAAVVIGDKVHTLGDVPGYTDLIKLVEWLKASGVTGTFVTPSLRNHMSMSQEASSTSSGVIALEIARHPAAYVLFLRPEVAQTVRWGGNPDKPVVASEDGFRLSPRKSFAAWTEKVQGRSLPWSKGEIRVANELRNLISVVAYAKE